MRGNIFALRRLRKLPHFSKADVALGGAERMCGRIDRKCAARRGRAGVVDHPINYLASGGALANILSSDDVVVIFPRDARAVDTSAEAGPNDAVDPGIDVGLLLVQHSSPLLLVEEDNGLRGKAFAMRGDDSRPRVGVAEFRCISD